MHKIVSDYHGNFIIGIQEGNDHAPLVRIKYPLLMKYESVVGKDVGKFELRLIPYDKVVLPKELRVKVVTMYEPGKEQIEQYEKERLRVWGE